MDNVSGKLAYIQCYGDHVFILYTGQTTPDTSTAHDHEVSCDTVVIT